VDLGESKSRARLGFWIGCCVNVSSGGGIGDIWVVQNAACIIFATLWGPYLTNNQHQLYKC
jgi:hypothetical protein